MIDRSKKEYEVRKGTVILFDEETGRGRVMVSVVEMKVLDFHSTDFSSLRPTRFPKNGEPVEVVFSFGEMLLVRSRRDG